MSKIVKLTVLKLHSGELRVAPMGAKGMFYCVIILGDKCTSILTDNLKMFELPPGESAKFTAIEVKELDFSYAVMDIQNGHLAPAIEFFTNAIGNVFDN